MATHNADGGSSSTAIEVLQQDLFDLYQLAGRNVTDEADSGEVRAYWPNRYLQALKRAVADGDAEVLAYVGRMVLSEAPSRGFAYLEAAGRLDLTVEALVADASKPYHHLFDADVAEAARVRLADHGYDVDGDRPSKLTGLAQSLIPTDLGMAVELTVEVTRDGKVLIHAGERTVKVDGTLQAVTAFTGLLAQAEAAAKAAG